MSRKRERPAKGRRGSRRQLGAAELALTAPSAMPPRAKQFAGVPTSVTVPLIPIHLPDGVGWAKNPHGIVIGVLLSGKASLGLCPIAMPSMRVRRAELVLDFIAADAASGALLDFNFLYFDRQYQNRAIRPAGPYACDGGAQTVSLDLGEHIPDRIVSAALDVDVGPFEEQGGAARRGGRPVVLRSVRLECFG